jgi:hypothetical protein
LEIIRPGTFSAKETVQYAQLLPEKPMFHRQSAKKVELLRKLSGSSEKVCYNEKSETLP